jgi:hypothetical protein
MVRPMIVSVVLMIGCRQGDRISDRAGAGRDSAVRTAASPARPDSTRADSGGRRDTAAVQAVAQPADPPCFASHLGLPCQ